MQVEGQPATPPAPPAPGTPEHDAAMVAKSESVNATGETVQAPAAPAPAAPVETPVVPAEAPAEPPAVTPPAAPVDLKALSAEYVEKGALSEDTYKALADKGFDKDIVDTFIEGQKARAAARDAIGYEAAGGKEAFGKMAEWAASNMGADEIAAFDKAVGGTEAEMKLAVAGLRSRYEAAFGSAPSLINGAQVVPTQGAFQSRAQATEAIKDPRYKSDSAYRADVERRIGAMANW